MKYIILHIICEGQTEEKFVKDVLSPYLQQFDIFSKPILLVTSKKKSARGGMLSYLQARHDLCLLIKQNNSKGNECHLFTTMFDYYALPDDFPGFSQSIGIKDVRQRISYLETEFARDIACEDFIPYIQLHEFEALLFTNIGKLSNYYALSTQEIARLKEETDKYRDPEMINDSPETAPSKRIIKALAGKYHYNKVQSGVAIASDIGIEAIKNRCQHFDNWVERIIKYAKGGCVNL